jgi:hypothetical protein
VDLTGEKMLREDSSDDSGQNQTCVQEARRQEQLFWGNCFYQVVAVRDPLEYFRVSISASVLKSGINPLWYGLNSA